MSTSTKATMPKPKRPLSGYNLFYRYKRNKVLEATARPNGRDRDNEAVIRAVLTALPGLEGVSPTSPLFRLCGMSVDEFRVNAIRKTMEGRLFPNENARKRVHCKVHGMGFVEMGRMMRQTWGRADKLTKDVFCELAEVGRARYRRLVAEYKISIARPENVKIEIGMANRDAASAVAVCENGTNRAGGLTESPAGSFHRKISAPELGGNSGGNKFASLFFKTTGACADVTNARAQSLHRKNSAPELGGIPSPAISRPVGFTGTSNRGAANRGSRIAASAAASGPTTRHATPFHRMNSTPELGGNGGGNKFASPPSKTMGTYGAATFATGDVGAGSDSAHADLEALETELDLQQSLLRNAIRNIKDRIIRNNSLLPTNMRVFPKEGIVPRDRVVGEKARLEITTSSGSSPLTQNNSLLPTDMRVFPKEGIVPRDRVIGEKARLRILTSSGSSALTGNGAVSNSDAPGGNGNGPEKGEISARDFVEFVDDLAGFVDKMDGAIDDRAIKPVFDMPIPGSISVPVDIELKNNRARVA